MASSRRRLSSRFILHRLMFVNNDFQLSKCSHVLMQILKATHRPNTMQSLLTSGRTVVAYTRRHRCGARDCAGSFGMPELHRNVGQSRRTDDLRSSPARFVTTLFSPLTHPLCQHRTLIARFSGLHDLRATLICFLVVATGHFSI